jgi:hypothetical protein
MSTERGKSHLASPALKSPKYEQAENTLNFAEKKS